MTSLQEGEITALLCGLIWFGFDLMSNVIMSSWVMTTSTVKTLPEAQPTQDIEDSSTQIVSY